MLRVLTELMRMGRTKDSAIMTPPLLGDGEGRFKVQVIGNSGIALAAALGVPYVSLDRLYWEPGWKETPQKEFQAKIRAALDQSDKGWVVDGNYDLKGGNMVSNEATDIVWLDPPLALYFPRIFFRTILRLFGLIPTCSPGCPETFREVFFSKKSILWWCLTNHWKLRKREHARIALMGQKMKRFGGWGGDLRIWMEDVADVCHAKPKGA
ncbi:hypothetical protein Hypma_013132 [Hypsizygus marmoreus]|uniref:Uncharacterized protein n=1 Tax=Hypsizygus marmoreus TaxID=39966 RepID=A0A369JKA4_HYPMA|nr:hypothetical protein Hypma_013132 [Hypsizygus marmoreus]